MIQHIARTQTGWRLFTHVRTSGAGWRQVGGDATGFMDDFGNFIFDKR